VQLSSQFTLNDLADQVPYIARLGVSHVYLSPIFTARPGSPHGYDIVDYGCINRELGGQQAWRRLSERLAAHGLGVVLDFVPNHMAADPVNNSLWRRVLEGGPASEAARYFDIDWRPLTGLVRDKVLLPLLEVPYGQALTSGAVQLERADIDFRIRCGSLHLPMSAASLETLRSRGEPDEAVTRINSSPDQLHQLLEDQHYRLAYWRPASDEINYRRFFGINELVAIHAEDAVVFARSHSLLLTLAGEDVVDGVRIDHVDGLLEPVSYLQQLQAALDTAAGAHPWIVVEKVLDPSETLGANWPVDGTTGYDALDALNRLFVSGRGVRVMRRFFQQLVDERIPFREEAYRSKRVIMHGALLSGVTMLAHELKRLADAAWATRDISLNALEEALVEFIASLPVYRTYLGSGAERPAEREVVIESLDAAIRRNPSMDSSAFAFLRSLMLGETVDDPALNARRGTVVKRLQQYTSGVHAKGVEDTAFFRDNTLLALNEVGGNPAEPSLSIRGFHRFNEHRFSEWPDAMTATSTHDTKLSEDARIRIGTLSLFPREWGKAVHRWRRLTSVYRRESRRGTVPDVRDEYRFYQALVGIWGDDTIDTEGCAIPNCVERLVGYMRKAAREAQLNTSWMRPDEDYESVLESFIRLSLTEDGAREFRSSVAEFVRLILPVSTCHSISQLVLKCFMPGVPDFYQGCEDWTYTLTDPDNRGPVDFTQRAGQLESADWAGALDLDSRDLKMRTSAALLRFRRDHEALVRHGTYRPLRVRGDRATSIVAFERRGGDARLVVAVPRLTTPTPASSQWPVGESFWGDTEMRLPMAITPWSNVLMGKESIGERAWCRVAELTQAAPWLVLHSRGRLTPERSRSR
jgi:(1->4)-alpha-D-glucan 1-alpha-D-glucosylmutase